MFFIYIYIYIPSHFYYSRWVSNKKRFNTSGILLYNAFVLNEAPLLRAAAIPVPADFDPTSKKSFTLPPPDDKKCGSVGILLLGYFIYLNPPGSIKSVFFCDNIGFPSDSIDTFPVNNDPSPILLSMCY